MYIYYCDGQGIFVIYRRRSRNHACMFRWMPESPGLKGRAESHRSRVASGPFVMTYGRPSPYKGMTTVIHCETHFTCSDEYKCLVGWCSSLRQPGALGPVQDLHDTRGECSARSWPLTAPAGIKHQGLGARHCDIIVTATSSPPHNYFTHTYIIYTYIYNTRFPSETVVDLIPRKCRKLNGIRLTQKFLCNMWKQRIARPNVGGVSTRSRNGAPSQKGCVVSGRMTKASNK